MVAATKTRPPQAGAAGDPYAPLLARGISREALGFFSVSLSERYAYPYWRYPVRDAQSTIIGWRYKRAGDDSGRRKYDWATAREPDPVWPGRSCPGPCADAVYNIVAVQAGRPAYVVAGEPDTWLFSSLGLLACSLLAGEGAVPEAAVAAIARRAPSRITVIYDHDETGQRGARALVGALAARGIAACARALPAEVGPKGDVTDLYRLVGAGEATPAGRERFVAALAALPLLPEPAGQQPLPQRSAAAHGPASGASPFARFKARHDLAAVITDSGVPLRAHQAGAYLQGRCPFHEDHCPSLVVWPARGYWKCYGCGARGDVVDYITRLQRLRGAQP